MYVQKTQTKRSKKRCKFAHIVTLQSIYITYLFTQLLFILYLTYLCMYYNNADIYFITYVHSRRSAKASEKKTQTKKIKFFNLKFASIK